MKKEHWILLISFSSIPLVIMLGLGHEYGFHKKVESISNLCEEVNGTIGGEFILNSNKSDYGCMHIPLQSFKEDDRGITFEAHPNAKIIINDCEKNHGKVEVSMNCDMTYNVECANRVF